MVGWLVLVYLWLADMSSFVAVGVGLIVAVGGVAVVVGVAAVVAATILLYLLLLLFGLLGGCAVLNETLFIGLTPLWAYGYVHVCV